MDCPYCNNKMDEGVLLTDSRTRVRWQSNSDKITFAQRIFTVKGLIKAKYTWTEYKIQAYYCERCKKIIIDDAPLK